MDREELKWTGTREIKTDGDWWMGEGIVGCRLTCSD